MSSVGVKTEECSPHSSCEHISCACSQMGSAEQSLCVVGNNCTAISSSTFVCVKHSYMDKMDSAQTVDFKRNQWSTATGADSGILFSLTQINAPSSTMRRLVKYALTHLIYL